MQHRHFNVSSDAKNAHDPIGLMVQHPSDKRMWGVRNETNTEWAFVNARNETIKVPPGRSVPAVAGNVVDFKNNYIGEFEV